MSDTNGRMAPSANGTAKKAIRNPTRRYLGGGSAWWGFPSAAVDGAPYFTWFDIPRMLRDPRVRLAERMWRAPFQRVKWAVRARNPKLAQFVGTTLRRLWRKSLPKLLSRYFRYGFAPGGAEFAHRDGLLRVDCVRTIEPRDAQPRIWLRGPCAGQAAGFTLAPGSGYGLAGQGDTWVGQPHAVWFAGLGEFGQFYDLPPMSGMFEPWLEKRGRNGAVHSRRLWYRKCAFRGGVIYHPDEVVVGPTDEPGAARLNGQDVARQTLEYAESGSVYTFTNEPNRADPSKYAWDYREPQAQPDVKGVLEYPQHLDGEMLEGAGIPPEVLEAADVGSGWSGRLIPLMAFLGGIDELAGLVIESLDTPIRHASQVNFGRDAYYEIEPKSLAEEVQQQAQDGKGGGEGDNPIPGLLGMGGKDKSREPVTRPTGGTLMSDDRSPVAADVAAKAKQLAQRRKRDLVQIVALAMLKAQEQAARRGKPESAGPYLDQLGQLAQDPERLAEITGAKSLSWVPYNGARGGHGWKNTETGRIVYGGDKPGEKREKAQASGQRAREILTKVTRYEATPDDLVELADHLPALPVARLRTARQLLGASWGGSKVRREGMVSALLEHVRGRIEEERKNGPAKDTRPEREGLPANWKDAEKTEPDAPKPKAAEKPAEKSSDPAASYRDAGDVSVPNSRINAAMRSIAGMSRAEGEAALKAMGFAPVPGEDPRRTALEMIENRRGGNVRHRLSDRGEIGAREKETLAAMNDEPLVTADSLLPKRAGKAVEKPAAPQPASPPPLPPKPPTDNRIGGLYATAATASQDEFDRGLAHLDTLSGADLDAAREAVGLTVGKGASAKAVKDAIRERILARRGATQRNQTLDRSQRSGSEPSEPQEP